MEVIMTDPTLLLYISTALACAYGFVMFLSWWIYMRRASEVYGYVTFLFLALLIDKVGIALFRYHMNVFPDDYAHILIHWIWPLRTLLVFAIVTLILICMTRRIIISIASIRRFRKGTRQETLRSHYNEVTKNARDTGQDSTRGTDS